METDKQTNPGESNPGEPKPKSFARPLPTAARILMGLIFLVFGLNGFLHFLPQPNKPMSEGATAFVGGLLAPCWPSDPDLNEFFHRGVGPHGVEYYTGSIFERITVSGGQGRNCCRKDRENPPSISFINVPYHVPPCLEALRGPDEPIFSSERVTENEKATRRTGPPI